MHTPLRCRFALPCLLAICSAGCRSEPLPRSTATTSTFSTDLSAEPLTLGTGDVLRVDVFGHPELSTPSGLPKGTRVDDQGLLSLPLVGTVAVGGSTLSDARQSIRDSFLQYVQDPHVDVSVLEYAARRFYLYGEVNHPGAYVIDRPLDMYQALTFGGGFTPQARRGEIVLLRGRPDTLEVRVIDGEHPDARGMLALRPDDLLFVRRTGAGKFSQELLPILSGISSSLGSVATLILIDERIR